MGWEDDFHDFLRGSIEGLAKSAWGLIQDAFSVGALTPEWWTTVVGGTVTTTVAGGSSATINHPGMLNIVVVAMLPLLGVFVAAQVIRSALRGSTAGMVRALVVAVFSVPAVYVVVGLVWLALGATQQMTMWILRVGAEGQAEDTAVAGVLALFGLSWDGQNDKILLDENYAQWEMASDNSQNGMILVSWIVALVIFLSCVVLMAMMIFRLVVILVLATFAPPVIFAMALEPAKAVFSKWLSMMLGLLMAAPMAAVIVRMGMIAASMSTDWVQTVAGVVLVLLASAMPLTMLSMMSFLTGGASDGVERSGVGAAQGAGRTASRSMKGAQARASQMRQRAASAVMRKGL